LEDQQKLTQIVNKHSVFSSSNSLPAERAESNEATLGMSSHVKSSAEIEDDLFFVDKKGESDAVKEDEKQSMGKSFIRAARNMAGTENDGKRKKTKKQEIRFQRHIQLDDPTNKRTLPESGSDFSMSEESDLEVEGLSNTPKRSRIETENLAVD